MSAIIDCKWNSRLKFTKIVAKVITQLNLAKGTLTTFMGVVAFV